MVAWMVVHLAEPRAGQKAAQKVVTTAVLKAECWVGHSAALKVVQRVDRWADYSVARWAVMRAVYLAAAKV